MKNKFRITYISLLFLLFSLSSCKKQEVPVLTTAEVTNITGFSATSGGMIISEGSGPVIERGITWSRESTPEIEAGRSTDGDGTDTFVSDMSFLVGGTTYYVRAYATNIDGKGYGDAVSFRTLGQLPSATTRPAANITTSAAVLNGRVNPNNLSTSVKFEYGLTTSYGSTITVAQSPLAGNTITDVSAGISELTQGTAYHFRIKTVNTLGTTYGDDMYFATNMTDIDGNIYNSIILTSRVWLGENLKTTRYNDGSTIANMTDGTVWGAAATGGYCWYDNNSAAYKNLYGGLYNWYAVSTGKLCPAGWHVPTDVDWTILLNYLGGESSAGGKLKEAGIDHWISPNTGATNETGFTALPGGARSTSGIFNNINANGFWWSSTTINYPNAWGRRIIYDGNDILRISYDKNEGFSVRCIKN